jgi:hypothetical protein
MTPIYRYSENLFDLPIAAVKSVNFKVLSGDCISTDFVGQFIVVISKRCALISSLLFYRLAKEVCCVKLIV